MLTMEWPQTLSRFRKFESIKKGLKFFKNGFSIVYFLLNSRLLILDNWLTKMNAWEYIFLTFSREMRIIVN